MEIEVSKICPIPEPTLDDYKALLKAHDWLYEWSDDQRVWARGREQRVHLKRLQSHLDPDASVWNSLCHPDCKVL